MKNTTDEIFVKMAELLDEDYIDPLEDPSHPDYEKSVDREVDVYRAFRDSQPKTQGKEQYLCPTCGIVFKEEDRKYTPLDAWAFKNGVATTTTTRGCPNCDPEKYDESKDPNSESAVAKRKSEWEKERVDKEKKDKEADKRFLENHRRIEELYGKPAKREPELQDVEEIDYWANDNVFKTANRKILSKWTEDFNK